MTQRSASSGHGEQPLALTGVALSLGAGVGAVVGLLIGGGPGIGIGAALGAGLGVTIGAALDSRR